MSKPLTLVLAFAALLLLPLAGWGREDKKGYVGIALAQDADTGRVVIREVLKDSPAEAAGLKKDDLILKVGDVENPDLKMVVETIRATKPGAEIVIKVQRGNDEKEIKVKVGELPNDP